VSVRANWHIEDLIADADADDGPATRVQDVGKPIDLDADEPALVQRLNEVVAHEKDLYHLGITCPIKDTGGACCSACPLAGPFAGTPRGRLCAIGQEQDRLVTTIAVRRHGAA